MSLTTGLERLPSAEKKAQDTVEVHLSDHSQDLQTPVVYKLYKRRWFGILTLVSFDKAPW